MSHTETITRNGLASSRAALTDGGLVFAGDEAVVWEVVAAGFTVASGLLAMVSLGGLAIVETDVEAPAPRALVAAAWVSWGVCMLSVSLFAALSTA